MKIRAYVEEMFQSMLDAARFQSHPPEFLITHPLTESRITDAKLRAQQYPHKQVEPNETFELVRVRAQFHLMTDFNKALQIFQSNLKADPLNATAYRYGTVLAYNELGNYQQANNTVDELLAKDPDNIFFVSAKAEIEANQKNFNSAIARMQTALKKYPNSDPLNIVLSQIMIKAGKYKDAESLLAEHSKRRPKDDYVWYLLAEAHGLAGDILGVHTARSEYFLLNGLYDKAESHLRLAMRMVKDDEYTRARLEMKLKEVQRLRREEMQQN